MKKKLIFILIFSSIFSCSIAQFSIGVQGGAGVCFERSITKCYLNNIYEGDFNFGNHPPPWFSPIGGLMVNVYYDKRFSLQSEILYINEDGAFFRNYPLGCIHFPEMIRYNIPIEPKSDKSFFIEAGPYFSYCCHYSDSTFIYSAGSNYLSRTGIGVAAGVGYKQLWGKGQIECCVKFQHNLIGQNATSIYAYTYLGVYREFEYYKTAFYKILSLTVSYSLQVKTIKKLLHPDKQKKKT
jgi:hypothetical protein